MLPLLKANNGSKIVAIPIIFLQEKPEKICFFLNVHQFLMYKALEQNLVLNAKWPWYLFRFLLNIIVKSARTKLSTLTSTCSYTRPAYPRSSGERSSTEFIAVPPHARDRRSMLRLLARLRPTIPSLANISKDMGSIPCKQLSVRRSVIWH